MLALASNPTTWQDTIIFTVLIAAVAAVAIAFIKWY